MNNPLELLGFNKGMNTFTSGVQYLHYKRLRSADGLPVERSWTINWVETFQTAVYDENTNVFIYESDMILSLINVRTTC